MSPVPGLHDGHRSATIHYKELAGGVQLRYGIDRGTYGSLGTSVGVPDGDPLTTVTSAVVVSVVDSTNVVVVATLSATVCNTDGHKTHAPSLRSVLWTHLLYHPQFPGLPFW